MKPYPLAIVDNAEEDADNQPPGDTNPDPFELDVHVVDDSPKPNLRRK